MIRAFLRQQRPLLRARWPAAPAAAAAGAAAAASPLSTSTASAAAAAASPPHHRVYMWGEGTQGQLGHWPFEKSGITSSYVELSPRELLKSSSKKPAAAAAAAATPTPQSSENTQTHNPWGFVDLAAGLNYTAGVTADGKLYTWGAGENHKLGHGDVKAVMRPKLVDALKDVKIVKVACGDFHTAAIDSEGQLWTWGWGGSFYGGSGGLGHGDMVEQARPKLVKGLLDYGCRVGDVKCGEKHTLILTDDGEVLTCGNGEYGRLGNGGSSDHSVPEPVEFFDENTDIVQIAAGHAFNLVLTKDGKIYTWGRNEQGQLGLGGGISMDVYSMEAVPLIVEGLQGKKIKAIAAGHSHSAAVTEGGELYMWGMKIYLEPHIFKVGETGMEKVEKIACGGAHTAAVTEDAAQLYTFGKGSSLCLGHGSKSYTPHPLIVKEGLGGRKVVKMACGHRHMGVLTE